MADISKITLPTGSTYNIKDQQARDDISAIQTAISGGVTFMGETSTALTDGSTTTSIVINSATITAVKGYLVVYNNKEFVFDGTKWIEMGDLSLIGDLGWKDSASTTYQPSGTVTKPLFTGESSTVTITATDNTSGNYQPKGDVNFTNENKTAAVSSTSGTATYTPAGTIVAPIISVSAAGSTTTVNSITSIGTLPSFGATVSNETLTLSFDSGTLPSKSANITVKTGDATYQASAPTFSGTGVRLVTGNISVPTSASFVGTKTQLSGTTTASGSVSQPTFTGTQATITVT